MKKRLPTLILLLLILMIRPALCHAEPALTLMVYLCGSNLETEAGAASADLSEMMAHYPKDGSIRIIVMPSGSKIWQSDVDTEGTTIYELTDKGLAPLCSLPNLSMGEPTALTALLDYGYTHFPAQQHALIMWNHGAGPNIGLCFDERFSTEDGMDGLTLPELNEALADSPAAEKKLAWIGFDACLMASVETASAIAPYADYMIASQETEPASGWSYAFLDDISKVSSGAETGARIIDAYFDSLSDSLSSLALSCVDLGHMPAINVAMDQLFNSLHIRLDETSYSAFADCRINSKSLGNATSYEYDLIDFMDLLQVYQADGMAECNELIALLDQAIVESRSNTPYVNGLSVYYPHYGIEDQPKQLVSEGYAAFIEDMSALRLGKPLTDWRLTSRPSTELTENITQVSMQLTQSQAEMLDTAMLLIIKQMSENDYQLVYRTNDVSLTEDHVLSAAYEEQALYIVDALGNSVSEALPYTLQGDAVVLSGQLTKNTNNIAEDENWFIFVDCYFKKNDEGQYRLAEIRERTAAPSLQGKATVRLEDYDALSIYQGSVIPSYAEDGSLLSPSQWQNGDMVYGWWFDLADVPDWSIAFLSQQDGRSRYAMLQMTDIQNQVICSDLVPIKNPNIIEIPMDQQTLVDNAYCCIRFTGADEIRGLYPSLRLNFTCENRDNQPISVNTGMMQLDDTIINCNISGSAVHPGKTESFEIEIDCETLERTGIQSVDKLFMNLNVNRNYTELLFEQPVECRLSADLSVIVPEPLSMDNLDTVTWDGLEFSLLELAVEDDAHIAGQLRIRNLSDKTVMLDTSYFYLDNLQCEGYLTDHIGTLTFQSGSQYFTGFSANLRGYPNVQRRPESRRYLAEALSMEQLNTLGIGVYHDDWSNQSRITFTLPHPLSLPVDNKLNRVDVWPVIYDKDGVTIRIADFTWESDSIYQSSYRYFNLYMDNRTDTDVKIAIPWDDDNNCPHAMVNGQRLAYIHAPTSPSQTKLMESIWYTVEDDNHMPENADMILEITDANGRMDKVHMHMEVLNDAQTEGSFRILDAEQLLITASPLNE